MIPKDPVPVAVLDPSGSSKSAQAMGCRSGLRRAVGGRSCCWAARTDAMNSGIHGVSAQWILGFMALGPGRRAGATAGGYRRVGLEGEAVGDEVDVADLP